MGLFRRPAPTVNLEEESLAGPYLQNRDLRKARAPWAVLMGINLSGANLAGANMYHANLRNAKLNGANLECAVLRDADLQGADLTGANLAGADLRHAKVTDQQLAQAANLQGATFPDGMTAGPRILEAFYRLHRRSPQGQ